MQPCERKSGGAVVKRRRRKGNRRVARAAICHGKCWSRRGVLRSRGSLPAAAIIGVQMAAGISAVGRRDAQRIIVVEVASGAGHAGMRVGQGESGRAVIKHARGPSGNGMAGSASRSRNRKS